MTQSKQALREAKVGWGKAKPHPSAVVYRPKPFARRLLCHRNAA